MITKTYKLILTLVVMLSHSVFGSGRDVIINTQEDLQKLTEIYPKAQLALRDGILTCTNLGRNGVNDLAMGLRNSTAFSGLIIKFNQVWNEEAGAIAELLKTNKTLTSLDLRANKIGNDGAKVIAEALKENRFLTILNLRGNNIGDDGAKVFAEALKINCTLRQLELANNAISEDVKQEITQSIERINNLSWQAMLPSEVWKMILSFLDFENAKNIPLCNKNFRHLISKKELKDLYKQIREVYINTEEDFEKLINTDPKPLLPQFSNWKHITFCNFLPAPQKSEELKRIFPNLYITITIEPGAELSDNITNEADQIRSDFRLVNVIIESHTKLVTKLLSPQAGNNLVTSNNIKPSLLLTALKQNNLLSLYLVRSVDLTKLKSLLNALENNKRLLTLSLAGNNIGDKEFGKIINCVKNMSLKQLDLTDNYISQNGVLCLGPTTLTVLALSSNNIGDKGATYIARWLKYNSHLESLSLSYNGIGDKGIRKIAGALRQNTILNSIGLAYNNFSKEAFFMLANAVYEGNTTLLCMGVAGNNITLSDLDSIRKDKKRIPSIAYSI